MKFGYIEEGDEKVDAWCVKFDKKIVTYVDSRGKGYKEDFVREELEAAIELYRVSPISAAAIVAPCNIRSSHQQVAKQTLRRCSLLRRGRV